MTNERASVIIGNIPVYGDECYSIAEYQEAKTIAVQALSQEPKYYPPCEDCHKRMDEIRRAYNKLKEQEPCEDAISRDFEIGDEVRMIGSDPIYDDCDVGWVIRNASEKVKTMYVMRNDGSADEEAKAEWYRTGRHNAVIAEVIKALPSVTQKSTAGHWISHYDEDTKTYWHECDRCHAERAFNTDYCPDCGCRMVATQEREG